MWHGMDIEATLQNNRSMKKLVMVLPLAILLAYCSGPNNTQTTDTDVDATSTSASTTGTTTDMATTSSDASTTTTSESATGTTTTLTNDNTSAQTSISVSGTTTIPTDLNDPMYQHWQRTNAQHWTYDMDYPGFDRPTAGSYNAAINGNWQLVMTPELVTAWRQDNSRSLWMNGSNTYLSASESFNTQNGVNATGSVNSSTNLNSSTNVNGSTTGVSPVYNDAATMPVNATGTVNAQGTVEVNESTSAGTLSSGTNAGTHGLNNNASANATVANQMNGSTANSSANTTVSANANTATGTTGVTGSTSATVTTGTTAVDAESTNSRNETTGINTTMDVNSINYNAANGNMYQLPKFNLFLDNGSFTGYTGCNGISGRVEVTGTGLRFLNTNTSTAIDCMGGLDESVLLDMLKRVDSYAYVGDELQLMQGSQVLLRFKKGNQDTSLR